jgi:hypothetical protein
MVQDVGYRVKGMVYFLGGGATYSHKSGRPGRI